jgi:L-gulonate 3-dehydrogenase
MTGKGSIAVIGAGIIGRSWAIAFARGGYSVALHDTDPKVTADALHTIPETLASLADIGLLNDQSPDAVSDRISARERFEDTLIGAIHVQENTPEKLLVKQQIFARLDAATSGDAVLASSTSALLPSMFTEGLAGASRCLVAHPLNPPHLIPAVELVPGPHTDPDCVARTRALMEDIGQSPIETTREIDGFIMNRLQGAVLDEAFWLLQEGLATTADIDIAVRDGLARRWVFMGPFETIDLNAPAGVADFMDRYADAYAAIGARRPNRPVWRGALREKICADRSSALRSDARPERIRWRDDRLAAIALLLSNSLEKKP